MSPALASRFLPGTPREPASFEIFLSLCVVSGKMVNLGRTESPRHIGKKSNQFDVAKVIENFMVLFFAASCPTPAPGPS